MAQLKVICEGLADEHRTIMALVDRLKRHRTVLHLVPILEELHTLLIGHFAREQFPGGLYEALGQQRPEYHDTLRTLINDHCVILSSARAVLERARVASEEDSVDILSEVQAVIDSLEQHEEKEHHLAEKILGQ
ncbi:MAG: hypothetical protein ACE5K1_06205 [Acidiferrobacterales bacterium]